MKKRVENKFRESLFGITCLAIGITLLIRSLFIFAYFGFEAAYMETFGFSPLWVWILGLIVIGLLVLFIKKKR